MGTPSNDHLDSQLQECLSKLDPDARAFLLSCLQRHERGELGAEEAVAAFGGYVEGRGAGVATAAERKSIDGNNRVT